MSLFEALLLLGFFVGIVLCGTIASVLRDILRELRGQGRKP